VAERPRLDAVLFDAGGTLVRLDFEWISEMLATLGVRATVEQLRRAEVHGRRCLDAAAASRPRELPPGAAHPAIGSFAPVEAYFRGLLEAVGCRHPIQEEALERLNERQRSDHFLWARPMEGARAALDALPALGLRAACVSNSDGRAEQHLVRSGVRDGLEFVIDSQLVGVEKPDPRIFRLALDRLGVRAGHALYVGDIRAGDEVGARAAGMPFVLVDPFSDYGDPGTPRIAALDELPAFLVRHFSMPLASHVPRA